MVSQLCICNLILICGWYSFTGVTVMTIGGLQFGTLGHRTIVEPTLVVQTIIPPPQDVGVTQGIVITFFFFSLLEKHVLCFDAPGTIRKINEGSCA